MGKESGLGDQLYIDGFDLGDDIRQFSSSSPLGVFDMTDITLSAMAREIGLRSGQMDAVVFLDVASNKSHAVLSLLPTTDTLITYGHGKVAGNAAANLLGKQLNYDPNRGQDGQVLFGVQALSNSYGTEWCTQLTAGKIDHTGAGNVASVNLGSASPGAFGLQMYWHLFSFTGTSITLKLQSSSDNGAGDAFADITGATTPALTARGSGRVATAAIAIEQYLRVVSVGTFSQATFLVMAHRNKVATTF